ncbi:MAG: LytTR family DNA-binding domain-containing protein [Ignavibacteriaceae bacterium]
MQQLKTIIVDDEKFSRENLGTLIDEYCPELEVVGSAASAMTARTLVYELDPDVIFLDINMPNENGFDFLNSIPDKDFSVVFATAHDEYGIQAVKAEAVDYLLKPIDIEELQNTSKKLLQSTLERRKERKAGISFPERIGKIIINHSQGFSIITLNDIIRLEGDSNYTKIYVKDEQYVITSKTLKELQEILSEPYFYRIHKSHIINLNFLKEYSNEDGGYAIMSDGSKIMISRRRHQEFIDKLREHTLFIK